VTKSSNCFARC